MAACRLPSTASASRASCSPKWTRVRTKHHGHRIHWPWEHGLSHGPPPDRGQVPARRVRYPQGGRRQAGRDRRASRLVDLSTVGSQMAVRIHGILAERNIVQLDSPVSGGVGGAEKGTLAVMVSGPRADFEAVKTALDVIGKVFFIGEKPGSAQTMKLANNLLSATAVVATSEAVVMGVKSGLDASVMVDVINAGSGMNTASRDKFPRAILPRTFDFGFATGLMVKDVRLCLDEMKALGLSMEVAEAVGRLWEVVIREMGAESDFTSAIKPIEKAAGVVVGGKTGHAAK